MDHTTVCILGLGYIGLPTAAVLAGHGARVFGMDVNPHVVDTINRGEIHIVEPELDAFVRAAVTSGRLTAHLQPQPADVFIIAVPTPFKDDHAPDLSYVDSATRALAPVLAAGNLVILESTSPVGTTERIAALLAEARPDLRIPSDASSTDADICVAHCPERVLPGQVIRELVDNDRIIGGITPACTARAVAFYQGFVKGECLATTARTAEMCKLTENAFRDVNIAFANELSLICERLGVNVWELIRMANHHPRVNILQPGCGVGGHCIAVDPWFIVDSAPEQARLIRNAREINDHKPEFVIAQATETAARTGARKIAVLGLAFKPDIDDLRESPALQIAKRLAQDHTLLIVEPHIAALPRAFEQAKDCALVPLDAALRDADLVLVLVKHSAFAAPLRAVERSRILDYCGALA